MAGVSPVPAANCGNGACSGNTAVRYSSMTSFAYSSNRASSICICTRCNVLARYCSMLRQLATCLHGTAACCNSLQRACTVLQHVAKGLQQGDDLRRHAATAHSSRRRSTRCAPCVMEHGTRRGSSRRAANGNGYCPSCEERPSLSARGRPTTMHMAGSMQRGTHSVALKGPLGTRVPWETA